MRMQHMVAGVSGKPPISGMVEDGRYSRGAADDSSESVP
jgi:hypothetical protein